MTTVAHERGVLGIWRSTAIARVLLPLVALLPTQAVAQEPRSDTGLTLDVDFTAEVGVNFVARFVDALTIRTRRPDQEIVLYPAGLLHKEADSLCRLRTDRSGAVVISRRASSNTLEICKKVLTGADDYYIETEEPRGRRRARLVPQAPPDPVTITIEHDALKDLASVPLKNVASLGSSPRQLSAFYQEGGNDAWIAGTLTTERTLANASDDRFLQLITQRLTTSRSAEVHIFDPATVTVATYKIEAKPAKEEPAPPVPSKPPANSIDVAKLKDLEKTCLEVEKRPDLAYYQVCLDMTTPAIPRVVVVGVEPRKGAGRRPRVGSQPPGHIHDGPLIAGKPIHARVYHLPGTEAELSISGEDSFPSEYFINSALAGGQTDRDKAAGGDVRKTERATGLALFTDTRVLSRASETVVVTAAVSNVKPAAGDKPEVKTLLRRYSHTFRNIKEYRGAVRIGLGLVWAPLDAQYGLRASGTPDNPGKEIYITDGGRPRGRLGAEFALGYSFYFKDIAENRRKPWLSWYLGLGLLSTQGDSARFFTSLHTGPELSISHNWSIVFAVSVRRTSFLKSGFNPGDSLPGAETQVPITAPVMPTVQFGLIVNFSPQALQIATRARTLANSATP